MPYITSDKRAALDLYIKYLHSALVNLQLDDPNNNMEGNLNYIFTRLIKMVYGENTTSYQDVNDVVGLLECVKLEFYRKSAAPYEDLKEHMNGPVHAAVEPTVTDETVVRQIDPSLL